jgi:hypothetical protein
LSWFLRCILEVGGGISVVLGALVVVMAGGEELGCVGTGLVVLRDRIVGREAQIMGEVTLFDKLEGIRWEVKLEMGANQAWMVRRGLMMVVKRKS